MKVFKDLTVVAPDAPALNAFLDDLQALLPPKWLRDFGHEGSLLARGLGAEMRCFVFGGEGSTPAAALWLSRHGERANVANIVPLVAGSLSHDEYNDLIARFATAVRKATIKRPSVRLELSEAHQDLEDWLSPAAATLLRTFAANANPSTGSSHPLDKERWHAFLIQAHQDACLVDPSLLGQWLEEDCDWAEDVALRMVIEYEQGRALLAAYDEAMGR